MEKIIISDNKCNNNNDIRWRKSDSRGVSLEFNYNFQVLFYISSASKICLTFTVQTTMLNFLDSFLNGGSDGCSVFSKALYVFQRLQEWFSANLIFVQKGILFS